MLFFAIMLFIKLIKKL